MKILGEKTLLGHPVSGILKQLIVIKNDLVFMFAILRGASERLIPF